MATSNTEAHWSHNETFKAFAELIVLVIL